MEPIVILFLIFVLVAVKSLDSRSKAEAQKNARAVRQDALRGTSPVKSTPPAPCASSPVKQTFPTAPRQSVAQPVVVTSEEPAPVENAREADISREGSVDPAGHEGTPLNGRFQPVLSAQRDDAPTVRNENRLRIHRDDLRRSVVMSEILDRPKSLRIQNSRRPY
ncbi:MAG: hypothetical protein U0L09_01595, partial [Christensenellales bacterium]|nr:hypothetical protein [Christensenellales bacterium]